MTEQTNPGDVGTSTSEFKLSLGTVITGLVALAGGLVVFLTQLQSTFPENKWVALGIAACGTIVATATALGYNKSRTIVKTSLTQAAAAIALSGVQVPPAAAAALRLPLPQDRISTPPDRPRVMPPNP